MKMKADTVHGENHAPFIKRNSRIVPEAFQKEAAHGFQSEVQLK